MSGPFRVLWVFPRGESSATAGPRAPQARPAAVTQAAAPATTSHRVAQICAGSRSVRAEVTHVSLYAPPSPPGPAIARPPHSTAQRRSRPHQRDVPGWGLLIVLLLITALAGGCTTKAALPRAARQPAADATKPPFDRSAAGPGRPVPTSEPVRAEGSQPQTTASPLASGPSLDAGTAALWHAVLTGDAAAATSAFFPLAAYLQVKTVPDPAADWQHRLFDNFALDVRAAHDLVVSEGPDPALVGVVLPSATATWIRPGACANRVGYWHVAGARLVYRTGGLVRSFGVASMISWRGVWYVVHLGAVVRHGDGGVLDRPATGPGTPGPAGGC